MRDYKEFLIEKTESFIKTETQEKYGKLLIAALKAIKDNNFNQYELRLILVLMINILENKYNELSVYVEKDIDEFTKIFKESLYEIYNDNETAIFIIHTIMANIEHLNTEISDSVYSNTDKIYEELKNPGEGSDNSKFIDISDALVTGLHKSFITNVIASKLTFMVELFNNGLDPFSYPDRLYSMDELVYIMTDFLPTMLETDVDLDIAIRTETDIRNSLKEYMAATIDKNKHIKHTLDRLSSNRKFESPKSGSLLN